MKNNLLYKILHTTIYPACLYFTVCIFVTAIIAYLAEEKAMAANLSFMVLLFFFSLFIALINNIFKTKLNSVLKVLFHFIGVLISFVLLFIVFTGYYKDGQKSFFIIICMVLVYVIVLSFIMVIKGRFSKKKNEKSNYKKQFEP